MDRLCVYAAAAPALGRHEPVSLTALMATLVLLAAFPGEETVARPFVIALLAVPILIEGYCTAASADCSTAGSA